MSPAFSVQDEIRQEIRAHGAIPFSRFMELALFSPHGGYYASPQGANPPGDYFTSPQAHPAFGALLGLQLEQMWELLGRPWPFTVVELGAGNGLLARDIASSLAARRPELAQALRYIALDRRPGNLLHGARALGVQKVTASGLPFRGLVGCILSNELLDAFPVHRFTIRQGRLLEVYVTSDGQGGLVEVEEEPSTPLLRERLERLEVPLREGMAGEVNLEVGPWSEEVAQALDRGFVITLDYGLPAEALYSPRRARGTLRSYYRHTQTSSPYLHVGAQDITADVDFSTLAWEGERHGLATWALIPQRDLLLHLGLETLQRALAAAALPQHQRFANQMGMLQLVEPTGMGRFWALIQGKGLGQASLWGLAPDDALAQRLEAFHDPRRLPLATPDHLSLLQGAYPHLAQEMPWEELWGGDALEEPEQE